MAQRGLDVRIVGDLSRAPPAVQAAAKDVEATSARMARKCGKLNIMFSYTATDELSRALASRQAEALAAQRVACCTAAPRPCCAEALCRVLTCSREAALSSKHIRPVSAECTSRDGAMLSEKPRSGHRNGVLRARVRVCAPPGAKASTVQDAPRAEHTLGGAATCSSGVRACGVASPRTGKHHAHTCDLGAARKRHACSCSEPAETLFRDIDSRLLTAGSPPVDLLLRTSGESRLSDYMVWQCRHAQLAWLADLWPALSFSTFVRCVLNWQRHSHELARIRDCLIDAESKCCQSGASKHA
jgi:hypothetical protein